MNRVLNRSENVAKRSGTTGMPSAVSPKSGVAVGLQALWFAKTPADFEINDLAAPPAPALL
jgi:hypothetical protein